MKPHQPQHGKAGNGHAAAAARRGVFVQAYIANGNNATQAAIAAGYSPKTAYSLGQRLLKNAETRRQLAEAAEKVAERAALTAERTLMEVSRISYCDPRRLFREDGTVKKITEMDADTSAAIANIEVEESVVDGVLIARTTRVRLWDKNAALEKAMKHLGLFERDNSQRGENIQIQIVPVERAPPRS